MDQKTNYTSKVNYLKRIWEYLVEEVKNGSFAIDIFTPVLLIDEIISEIIVFVTKKTINSFVGNFANVINPIIY